MSDPDKALLLHVIAHDDRHAFGELVKRHQSAVRNLLCRLTRGDAARADDLAQETFLKAYRALSTFRGEAVFSSWLYRVAYHVFLSEQRRRHETVVFDESHAIDTAPSPATQSDLAHDLHRAMAQLSDEQIAIFDLTFKKGLSHNEVASALDLPLGTVKTRLARGLELLRRAMQDWRTNHVHES